MNFIKTNNHINIVLANVPIRYDLSYRSQVNMGIRSYNKKLMEITKEHNQVALIVIVTVWSRFNDLDVRLYISP